MVVLARPVETGGILTSEGRSVGLVAVNRCGSLAGLAGTAAQELDPSGQAKAEGTAQMAVLAAREEMPGRVILERLNGWVGPGLPVLNQVGSQEATETRGMLALMFLVPRAILEVRAVPARQVVLGTQVSR